MTIYFFAFVNEEGFRNSYNSIVPYTWQEGIFQVDCGKEGIVTFHDSFNNNIRKNGKWVAENIPATQVGKAAVWPFLLFGLVGAVAVAGTISAFFNTLALAGVGIVYVKTDVYYKPSVVTSRPQLTNCFYFYKNLNDIGVLGTYECRS